MPLSPVTDKGTSGSPALDQSRRSSVVLPEHGVQMSLRGLERTELCRIQTHVVNMNIFKAKCVVPYNLFPFVFLEFFVLAFIFLLWVVSYWLVSSSSKLSLSGLTSHLKIILSVSPYDYCF